MWRRSVNAAVLLAGLALGGIPAPAQQVDVPVPPGPFPDRAAPRPISAPPLPDVPVPKESSPRPDQPPALLDAPGGLNAAPSLAERPRQPELPPAFRLLHPPGPAPLPPVTQAVRRVEVPDAPGGRAQLPTLTLEKHGPESVRAGQPAVFELVVRNVGALPASGLRVEDDLPPGARLVATSPPAVVQGQRLDWSLEVLGPGQESRFRMEFVPSAAGEFASRALVSLPLAVAAAHTRVAAPSLGLRVQAPASATVGQNVDVKIRLLSLDGRPVRGVALRVRLPEGLQHEGGKEIETDPFDLDGEAVKDIDLHVRAVRPGRQVLEAEAAAPGQQARGEAAVLVTEAGPAARPRASLVIHKTGTQRPVQGEQYDYKLEVENRGPAEIANVCLFDRLPAGLDMVAAGQGGIYDAAGRTVQWRLGSLPPGQRRTVTLRLQARLVGEQVNQVWASGEPGQEARLTATLQVDSRGASAAAKKNR